MLGRAFRVLRKPLSFPEKGLPFLIQMITTFWNVLDLSTVHGNNDTLHGEIQWDIIISDTTASLLCMIAFWWVASKDLYPLLTGALCCSSVSYYWHVVYTCDGRFKVLVFTTIWLYPVFLKKQILFIFPRLVLHLVHLTVYTFFVYTQSIGNICRGKQFSFWPQFTVLTNTWRSRRGKHATVPLCSSTLLRPGWWSIIQQSISSCHLVIW